MSEYGEGISAQRLAYASLHRESFDVPEHAEGDSSQRPKHRARRSAAQRRAQHLRAHTRMTTKLLAGLLEIDQHRGCQLSLVGRTLLTELQKPSQQTVTSDDRHVRVCRHYMQGRCTWGERCKFAHPRHSCISHRHGSNHASRMDGLARSYTCDGFVDGSEYHDIHEDRYASDGVGSNHGYDCDTLSESGFERYVNQNGTSKQHEPDDSRWSEQHPDHDGDGCHATTVAQNDVEDDSGSHCTEEYEQDGYDTASDMADVNRVLSVLDPQSRESAYQMLPGSLKNTFDLWRASHGQDIAHSPSDGGNDAPSCPTGAVTENGRQTIHVGHAIAHDGAPLAIDTLNVAPQCFDDPAAPTSSSTNHGRRVGLGSQIDLNSETDGPRIDSEFYASMLRAANMNQKVASRQWQARTFDNQKVDSMFQYACKQDERMQRHLIRNLPWECSPPEKSAIRLAYKEYVSNGHDIKAALAHSLKATTRTIVSILR